MIIIFSFFMFMKVTSPASDTLKKVKRGWGSGKCDELAFVGKINPICTDDCLGGWWIRVPYPCP
jgi:hypothetical protein